MIRMTENTLNPDDQCPLLMQVNYHSLLTNNAILPSAVCIFNTSRQVTAG